MNHNTRRTEIFIGLTLLAATGTAGYAMLQSHVLHLSYALAVLALAAVTSRMKVKLPGINGNMSVNLPFLLLAVLNLSAVEAVAIACTSTLVQGLPKRGSKFKGEQMLFNVGMMAFASGLASLIHHAGSVSGAAWASGPMLPALTTAVFFLGQTLPVSAIITLADGGAMQKTWSSIAQLSFPYYVLSAGITSMVNMVSARMGWPAALVVFPVMYGIHRSYQLYFSQGAAAPRTAPLARAASTGM